MKKFPLPVIVALSVLALMLLGLTLPSVSRASMLPDTYLSGLLINLRSGALFAPQKQEPSPTPSASQTPPASTASPTQTPAPNTPEVSESPASQAPEHTSPTAPPGVKTSVPQNFTTVDRSYFDDAAFIGDSRMVGMQEYSGLRNSDYFALTGLTVFYLFDNYYDAPDGSSKSINLEEALKRKQYGKIYIMVGINELGSGSQQYFKDTYQEAIERIKNLQPNAIIFIQGILYVTGSRSETDKYINNKNIRERNSNLAALADGKRVFYIDVNEVTSDANGNLNSDYSWDSCHLQAKYYGMWTDFLMRHGVTTAPAATPAPTPPPTPTPTPAPSPTLSPSPTHAGAVKS